MTTHEDVNVINDGEKLMQQEALLRSREMFFGPASLEEDVLFCGDDRPSDVEDYIHVFGGASNFTYNRAILKEIKQPGSTDTTFESDTHAMVPVLIDVAKVNPGVHNVEDDDCGYNKKHAPISAGIKANGDAYIQEAMELRPELFTDEESRMFAQQAVDAHGRLAENASYFTSGKAVGEAALEEGASCMSVYGDHVANEGIISLVPNSKFNTTAAHKAGLDTYVHDAWAVNEANDRLRSLYPFDKREQEIAELIDTIGTMHALGVTVISVRRPQAA